MLAKHFSIIRNYMLSVSSQRKYNFYHQNTLLNAFRTNSRNIIGRNPSMVIPLLPNQDLTPMLFRSGYVQIANGSKQLRHYFRVSETAIVRGLASNIFTKSVPIKIFRTKILIRTQQFFNLYKYILQADQLQCRLYDCRG